MVYILFMINLNPRIRGEGDEFMGAEEVVEVVGADTGDGEAPVGFEFLELFCVVEFKIVAEFVNNYLVNVFLRM